MVRRGREGADESCSFPWAKPALKAKKRSDGRLVVDPRACLSFPFHRLISMGATTLRECLFDGIAPLDLRKRSFPPLVSLPDSL
jgi:hypothetical protein